MICEKFLSSCVLSHEKIKIFSLGSKHDILFSSENRVFTWFRYET